MTTSTPRVKRKRPPQNSPGDDNLTICLVCLDPIIDATEKEEGQEAIFCESLCNSWLHRQCAGLSQALYKLYQDGDDPFFCPHCRLTTQESQLRELKSAVESLTKEVALLKSAKTQSQQIISPQSSIDLSQTTQSTSAPSHSSASSNQKQIATAVKKPDDKTQDDRKFNVVIYGINECSKGTPKNERLNHDLDKVTSIIAKGDNCISPLSIRDLLRLGKYREQSKRPRPILVKLNRAIDVLVLLSKAKSLPTNIKLKPDMSPTERLVESLLLKERWSLIQRGIDRRTIKIRSNKIFVQQNLHGQVIDSTFALVSADSSNSAQPTPIPCDTSETNTSSSTSITQLHNTS